MLIWLADLQEYFGPLRLFRYLTVRSALAGGLSLMFGMLLAPILLRWLRALKMGQSIRQAEEVGRLAELHSGKAGTPTMGGLIIFFPVVITTVLLAAPNIYVLVAMFVYVALTALGFADDYLKVTRRNSRGVSSRVKLAVQAVVAIGALALLLAFPSSHFHMSQLWVPFVKNPLMLEMPLWFLFIFFFLIVAGSSNAINLTDGVDGLAIGCTVTVALVYAIMAYVAGHRIIADYLFISYIPGAGELTVVCAAVLGASLAFLWYNCYPASVFMGDTGSLAIGGLIGTIAFMVHQPLTLIIAGGIFVAEAGSVILQVGSFKLFGRRIFRMSPIHHHFELAGWPETKVVIRFWILSLIFALAGLATLKLR